MMKKNSRQDNGCLGAHVAGQAANGVQGLYRFFGRRWNRSQRTCGGPYPAGHSLTEEEDEAEATAGKLTQHVLSQLLVTSHPILRGRR